jgi:hypothetical protein
MGSKSASLRALSVAIVALACVLAVPSGAARLENFYSVTVPLDSTARNQREAAIQAAMAQLLIRVTGNRDAPLDPALGPLIASAASAEAGLMTAYGPDQRNAFVEFNGSRVERALTELGVRFWGPSPPRTRAG